MGGQIQELENGEVTGWIGESRLLDFDKWGIRDGGL